MLFFCLFVVFVVLSFWVALSSSFSCFSFFVFGLVFVFGCFSFSVCFWLQSFLNSFFVLVFFCFHFFFASFRNFFVGSGS